MATLIAETKWDVDDDGSPSKAYFSALYDTQVESPYYFDNRDVPVHGYVNSDAPLSELSPGADILVPGPAAEVSAELTGLIPTGTSLTYGFTGPNIGTFGGSLPQNGPLITAATWAEQVASGLNIKHGDVILATAADGVVTIVANDGSDVTITTWTLV
jgi:hypothetical protein